MPNVFDILSLIKAFIRNIRTGQWKAPWFQASFCLFIMGSQWVVLESIHGISMVKVVYMCLTPFFMLLMYNRLKWDVIVLVIGVYFGLVCLSAFVFSAGVFKVSSICYMFMFLSTYCYFMSLIYSEAFTYEFYLKFLRGMLLGYFYIIVLQQITAILHIHWLFKIFNCHGFPWGWKFPGMNLEPSHASRMILAIGIALVELLHVRDSSARGLQYLLKNEKYSIIAFCYSELTNGGSTGMVAFLVMGLYILYFSKRSYFILGLIFFLILVYTIRDTVAMQRFVVSAQATATMDEQNIIAADTSAAARILIFTKTLETLSPFDYGFWTGYGLESSHYGIGILLYYGFFTYAALLIILFKYVFRGIFDIEFLVFVVFLWATIGNVAHAWAIVMYWSATKYFSIKELSAKKTRALSPINQVQLG